jgi:hypothetical protein
LPSACQLGHNTISFPAQRQELPGSQTLPSKNLWPRISQLEGL